MKNYIRLASLLALLSYQSIMTQDCACQKSVTRNHNDSNVVDEHCKRYVKKPKSCCKNKHHTFLMTRPVNQNLSIQQAVWHDYIYEKRGYTKTSIQAYGIYQQSIEQPITNSYFLYCGKEQLYVAGDAIVSNENSSQRDVRAEWLGLPSNFSGYMTLAPAQKQFGINLEINQNVNALCNFEMLKDYWVSIVAPIVVVQNDIGLKQNSVKPSMPSLIETFQQPSWHYAKFVGKQNKWGIAEICIRFGRAFLNEDNFQVIYYSGFRLPVGGTQNAEYTFNPVVGNNGHLALVTGVNFQLALGNCDSKYNPSLFTNMENSYFAKNNQWRTLDIKDKPWSRYMLLNKKDGGPDQNIPAMNILTQHVSCHPHNIFDGSAGFRAKRNGLEFEIAYDLWVHGKEKVELNNCFPADYGIAGTRDPNNPGFATTASNSTIEKRAGNDVDANGNPVFVEIRKSDLDFCSGGAHNAFTNRVHISLGMGRRGCRIDAFANFGAFYELPNNGGALSLWGAWAKIGGQF